MTRDDSFCPEEDITLYASRAIETARRSIPYLTPGPILRGPLGGPVDAAILYSGIPVDIIHYDPYRGMPSPKGRPVHYHGSIDERIVRKDIEAVLRELQVLGGAEYREPEQAWIVPVAWRSMIVLHIRVSWDGRSVKPDHGLQTRLLHEHPPL